MGSLAPYNKALPPVLVSSSLEGLEIGIPPSNHPSPYWHEKPLPKPPAPDRPSSIYSTEDKTVSSTISLVDYPEKTAIGSNDSLPRTKSDINSDITSTRFYRRRNNVAHRNSLNPRSSERCSIGFKTFLTEEQYGVGMHLARANHYFREKKWEIFPELGPQTASPTTTTRSPRKGRPRLPKGFSRQQLCKGEVFGISLKPVAEHIRPVVDHMKSHSDNLKPVASQIQHRLVTKTSRLRLRKKSCSGNDEGEASTRMSRNGPSSCSSNNSNTTLVNNAIEEVVEEPSNKPNFATVRRRMHDVSRPGIITNRSELKKESLALWKSTSTSVLNIASHTETNLTPTAATTTRPRRSCSQPPSSYKNRPPQTSASSDDDTSSANDPDDFNFVRMAGEKPILSIQTHFHASPPISPSERGRHLRSKSKSKTKASLVFVAAAYDGARQRIADAQAARRRAEMKKQIRLVGPIGQYPDGSINHWV